MSRTCDIRDKRICVLILSRGTRVTGPGITRRVFPERKVLSSDQPVGDAIECAN